MSRRHAAAVLLLACLTAGSAWTLEPHHSPARCEEDQPCWDCRTMGNLICGEVAP